LPTLEPPAPLNDAGSDYMPAVPAPDDRQVPRGQK